MSIFTENTLAVHELRDNYNKLQESKQKEYEAFLESEANRYENARMMREKKPIILAEFKTYIRDNIFKYVIEDMMSEAIDLSSMDDREINRMHAFTESFIKENGGAYSILAKAKMLTPVIEEVTTEIETATQEIFDKCNTDDCSNMVVDGKDLEKVITTLNKSKEYEDIKEEIANKVTNAEIGFVEKKKLDDARMQEIIQKAEEKVAKASIDPEISAETKEAIQQEAAISVKRARTEIYENGPYGLFEEMVNRFTKSVMNSDILRESYTLENGRLDTDKLVTSVRTMYSILETVNTAKFIKVNEEYIKNMLDEM